MSEEQKCVLCGEPAGQLYRIHLAFEKRRVDEIKATHPDWKDGDGGCFMCVNAIRADYGMPNLTEDEAKSLSK